MTFTEQEINEAIKAALADKDKRIELLEQRDSEAATYVESQIAMLDRFTGDPPYVGWKGLGLALQEELEDKDKRISELEAQIKKLEGGIVELNELIKVALKSQGVKADE